ncbi:unnamed protein product [Orchesella dallaii]
MTMAHLPGRKNLALTLSALHILSSILTKSHTHYVSQVKSIYVPLNPRRELSMEQGNAVIFMQNLSLFPPTTPTMHMFHQKIYIYIFFLFLEVSNLV